MLLKLFIAFFKVGLFTIGGGLVAIPLMQDFVLANGWIDEKTFIDMIAVSQSTPGPIGINLATYIGQTRWGLVGSIVATLGMVFPSFLIIMVISHFLKAFKENLWVQRTMTSIRPVAIGAILAAAGQIALVSLFKEPVTVAAISQDISTAAQMVNVRALIMFLVLFGLMFKIKLHPILYIVIGGVLGIVFL